MSAGASLDPTDSGVPRPPISSTPSTPSTPSTWFAAGPGALREGPGHIDVVAAEHQPLVHSVRVAIGLGNAEREQELLPVLTDPPDGAAAITVERCLTVNQVQACVERGQVDALLLATDLHRLSPERLASLGTAGIPLVLLTSDAEHERWRAALPASATVIPLDAPVDAVRSALVAALGPAIETMAPAHGGPEGGAAASARQASTAVGSTASSHRGGMGLNAPSVPGAPSASSASSASAPPRPTLAPQSSQEGGIACLAAAGDTNNASSQLSILAIASGPGSPGRTTLATSLAAALGTVAPTVLIDLDLDAPSIATHLDLDPTRNLYMMAHAEPVTPREWERVLADETQTLSRRSPHAAVLCGVPKPEMRPGVSAPFLRRLLAELRQRYRYVVLDTGAECLSPHAVLHREAVAAADQVLLVAAADVVGLWHAQAALTRLVAPTPTLRRAPTGASALSRAPRVALVVNRYDRHYHYERQHIEWALSTGVAALIPFDHAGAERALAGQQPLVFDERSRAGRTLLDLAERVHGGRVLLPPEPMAGQQRPWRRWLRGASSAGGFLPNLTHTVRGVSWLPKSLWLGDLRPPPEARRAVAEDAVADGGAKKGAGCDNAVAA